MKVTTSKSKNAESFYISKSFINDKGVSTSVNIRKLGTLDGMYAVSTDLLDDNVSEILSISEKRWQIEECFRI